MSILCSWRGDKKPQGVKAFLGWAGVSVQDEDVDVLDMLRGYMRFAAGESCGQCFPCREGLIKIRNILDRLCDGQADPGYESELQALAGLVRSASRCDIGQTSPQPLLDILNMAPHLLRPRITAKKDYTSTITAPCINACPSNVNVPDYIEKIRFRQFDKALDTVLRDCPMPGTIGRVCVRPCESACKRNMVDSALAIKRLKRFLADEDMQTTPRFKRNKPHLQAKRVAVIGAGPSGLSCAYYLTRLGFFPTIFEKQECGGGMAKFGIPDYRQPPEIMNREVERIKAAGCEMKYGVEIGKDLTLTDLETMGFEAVFIGTGAEGSVTMNCEGEDSCSEGLINGVAFLAQAARGEQTVFGKRLVVIGGGNVAMDCVRTALRQGFTDVHLVYRRTIAEMPADPHEIRDAMDEGVIFNFLAAPLKIISKDGKLTSIICQKMELGAPDASGRRKPVPVENGELEIPCDVVIPAIGQAVSLEVITKGLDGALTRRNTLAADPLTCQVDEVWNLFGGGDCMTGPSSLISALAAGKRAALHIGKILRCETLEPSSTEKLKDVIRSLDVWDCSVEGRPCKGHTKPMPVRMLPPDERIKSFAEVEGGASEPEAISEARRCLRCYRLAMAEF